MDKKKLLLSKISMGTFQNLPEIKKTIFYFLINLKQYKKGELLLFIALALLFRGLHVVKYTEFRGIQVFRVTLEKVQFFKTFVSFYLPTLGLQENYVQTLLVQKIKKKNRKTILQITYKSMCCLPELDVFYSSYDLVFTILSSYRVLLSLHIKNCIMTSGIEAVARLYRLPCKVL